MKEFNIRPAVDADLGDFKVGASMPPFSCKIWAVEHDGKVCGVFGFVYAPNNLIAFSEISDGIDVPLMTKWKAIEKSMDVLKKHSSSFYAISSQDHDNSGKMLRKLGFDFFKTTHETDFYIWQTHLP